MYTNAHKERILINSLQISLNRVLLLLVGLWPYQQSKLVRIQLIILVGILTTFVLFQLTVFLTLKCTMDLLINVLSSALFGVMIAIKYIMCGVNIKNIQYLLEQLQHIYNELTDENEIIIIEKYGYYAKCYTITFTLMLTSAAFALILYNHWPDAYHILFYTNGTWSHRSLPYMTEYFMDKDKYFHVILFHANATFVVGGLSVVATGSILVVYAQHACGMFQIACYRIKRAMAFENLQKSNLENKNLICKGLICAVDMHRKAMTFADSIAIKFETVFSSFIIVGVVCASLNLYRIILFGYNTVELFIRLSYGSVQLFYALIGNYLAQEIIDNNNNIFVTIYDVQWYVAPLQIQKMILFVLQRGAKLFMLKTGGIFVGSLEGAATLISTTVSYFTVLYSLRN